MEPTPETVFKGKKAADDRPDMRPEIRVADPRARAAEKAKQIMEHRAEIGDGHDEFYIAPSLVPDGWIYEWKRASVHNQEDRTYIASLIEAGWDFVEYEPRLKPLVGPDYSDKRIVRKGLVLMEIPEIVYKDMQRKAKRIADQQVRHKEGQLAHSALPNMPPGFAPDNSGRPIAARGVAGFKSSWQAGVPVPD